MLLQAVNFTGYRFSINDWKENVESLNISLFWEETQSSVNFLLPTHPWMGKFLCHFLQMLSIAASIEVSVVYMQLFHVNLLARTVFENICFPCFLHKLIDRIGLVRKSWVHKTVTKRPLFPLYWLKHFKHCFERMKSITTVNHFTINHAV